MGMRKEHDLLGTLEIDDAKHRITLQCSCWIQKIFVIIRKWR